MRPTTAEGNVFDFNALLHPARYSIILRTLWAIPA